MSKIPNMIQPNPDTATCTPLERAALEALVTYRTAQIAADRHVYTDTPQGIESPYTEADLLDLYVASRVAVDKVIVARRMLAGSEE